MSIPFLTYTLKETDKLLTYSKYICDAETGNGHKKTMTTRLHMMEVVEGYPSEGWSKSKITVF